MHTATFFDGAGWREGVVEVVDGGVRLRDEAARATLPHLDGVIVGGFTDHHVHLQLVDPARLTTSRLGRVIDLGGNPTVLRQLAVHNSARTDRERPAAGSDGRSGAVSEELSTPMSPHPVDIAFAGAFLTAPGGYPSDRDWAPAGSVREVVDADAAAAAVAEMAAAGAAWIKVASNTLAGPALPDELFRTIIGLAADHGLSVVAHAEGPGEAQRTTRLGATRLAHAPFTERLADDELARQAVSTSWITTLAIHDDPERATAIDNVRRFRAAGGTVLYGTDMGNGPTPIDLDPAEIAALREAGLDDDAVLQALAPADPRDLSSLLLFLPGGSPTGIDPLHARPLTADDLKV